MSLLNLSNGCVIQVKEGSILDFQGDVIVNSTNRALVMNAGNALSRAILEKAGEELQEECETKYPDGFDKGTVAVTGAYGLPQKMICHVYIPSYDSDETMDDFKEGVRLCLTEAHIAGHSSIAFPPLGCGVTGYPKPLAAETTIAAMCNFFDNIETPLKDVRIIVLPSEKEAIKAFKDVIEDCNLAMELKRKLTIEKAPKKSIVRRPKQPPPPPPPPPKPVGLGVRPYTPPVTHEVSIENPEEPSDLGRRTPSPQVSPEESDEEPVVERGHHLTAIDSSDDKESLDIAQSKEDDTHDPPETSDDMESPRTGESDAVEEVVEEVEKKEVPKSQPKRIVMPAWLSKTQTSSEGESRRAPRGRVSDPPSWLLKKPTIW